MVLVKIKNSPDSDLPDLLLRTQFDFTVPAVIATTPEEEKAKQIAFIKEEIFKFVKTVVITGS